MAWITYEMASQYTTVSRAFSKFQEGAIQPSLKTVEYLRCRSILLSVLRFTQANSKKSRQSVGDRAYVFEE